MKKKNIIADLIVVFLCFSISGISIYKFQDDLFKTLKSLSSVPVGTVTVKYNKVQRLLSDRVLWDRLNRQSPVYQGDVIRVARQSGAILNIDENALELNENTLIRINKIEGVTQIEIDSGNINFNSGLDGGTVILMLGEYQLEAKPGAALSASIGLEGLQFQISEGITFITSNGQVYEAQAGTVIMQDTEGNASSVPMAAVTSPRPNARYLSDSNPFVLNFSWNRVNMDNSDLLRLEISKDQNFSSVNQIKDNLFSGASAALEEGAWYWRIKLDNAILTKGRVSVLNVKKPQLLNPVNESEFLYRINRPDVLFRWTEADEAEYYLLQIGNTPVFGSNVIELKVQGTSCNYPYLGTGNWYWRVLPVYSALYKGSAAYSDTAGFKIKQGDVMEAPVLISPADEAVVTLGENRKDIYFSWTGGKEALSYTIQIAGNPDMQNPVISETVLNNYYIYAQNDEVLSPGRYYWNVYYTVNDGSRSPFAGRRSVIAREDTVKELFAGEKLPAVTRPTAAVNEIPDTSVNLTLISPSEAAAPEISPVVSAVKPEPVLSAAAPTPKPSVTKTTPVTRARQPEKPQVKPLTLLDAPKKLTPEAGHKVKAFDLRINRNIEFSWQPVDEANAYILTINGAGNKQIFRGNPIHRTSFNYTDLDKLDYMESYSWNVEAVYVNSAGGIERHGRPAYSSFILDIPAPGKVQTAEAGVMYGN